MDVLSLSFSRTVKLGQYRFSPFGCKHGEELKYNLYSKVKNYFLLPYLQYTSKGRTKSLFFSMNNVAGVNEEQVP